MGKLVLFMHTSLDGFVAGPAGQMDWIHVDEELFEYASMQTAKSGTALYGRVTYQMMEAYWPTAGDQPNASKHDIEHSAWYNKVPKIVLSRSMEGMKLPDTTIISNNMVQEVREIKRSTDEDIVIFGSPSASHSLMQQNLIDEYWLFVNPVILGSGIPLFKDISHKINLKLHRADTLSSGVLATHYEILNDQYPLVK